MSFKGTFTDQDIVSIQQQTIIEKTNTIWSNWLVFYIKQKIPVEKKPVILVVWSELKIPWTKSTTTLI